MKAVTQSFVPTMEFVVSSFYLGLANYALGFANYAVHNIKHKGKLQVWQTGFAQPETKLWL